MHDVERSCVSQGLTGYADCGSVLESRTVVLGLGNGVLEAMVGV